MVVYIRALLAYKISAYIAPFVFRSNSLSRKWDFGLHIEIIKDYESNFQKFKTQTIKFIFIYTCHDLNHQIFKNKSIILNYFSIVLETLF